MCGRGGGGQGTGELRADAGRAVACRSAATARAQLLEEQLRGALSRAKLAEEGAEALAAQKSADMAAAVASARAEAETAAAAVAAQEEAHTTSLSRVGRIG
jgi:hypothetical protein